MEGETAVGPPAAAVSEIPAPDSREMICATRSTLIVGSRLPRAAARDGEFVPHRRASARIQVNSHPVSLLADARRTTRPLTSGNTVRFLPTSCAFARDRILLFYLIGASGTDERQAKDDAPGETIGNKRDAVRRLPTASYCGKRRCLRVAAGQSSKRTKLSGKI